MMSMPIIFGLGDKQAERDRLFEVYEKIERDRDELKCAVAQFMQRYAIEVGKGQYELKRLNVMIAAKPVDAGVLRGKADQSVENSLDDGKVRIRNGTAESAQASAEAKRVYRRIAAIIHPDKSRDESSRVFRTRLMTELNAAYLRKDIAAMKQILDEWHESPEAVSGEGPAAELLRANRVITQLKKKISATGQEIFQIRCSDMYRLMVQVQEDERAGRDDFRQMQATLNQQILDAQNRLIVKMYG
jgi:hypothetical protein